MDAISDLTTADAALAVQGYVDERSTHHAAGWLRNLNNPAQRLGFEIVLPTADGERILHAGIADAFSDTLVQVGVGDGAYAFRVTFDAPLTVAERDRLFIRAAGTTHILELAPALQTTPPGQAASLYQGYVDERSIAHIAGWVWDLHDKSRRVELDIILPEPAGERLLKRVMANEYNEIVAAVGIGDGTYAFFVLFDQQLTEAERDLVFVRPAGSSHILEHSPALRTAFEPINHVAMDIVNNCNLRCPFCVYDYTHTNKTYFMSDETFEATLKLIPFVTEGNFWLSCLHEATLHPKLIDFIERVPRQWRKKLFFTTNLAKRMPLSYFEGLANSGMSHINISVESLDPVVYERMRKGARFSIFQENWDKLLEVFIATPGAPRIRYNMMAYRSNMLEIPRLAEHLRREKHGTQIEIRNTFDGPQIDAEFRNFEFLTTAEWAWLAEQLKHWPQDEVLLLTPPGGKGFDRYNDPTPPPRPPPDPNSGDPAYTVVPGPAPRPFSIRISWDGTLIVYAERQRAPGEPPTHSNYLFTNVRELEDPLATLFAL